jgi:DNA methylase
MVVPVIISINPLRAVRGSNIRQVRSKFVAELVESIRENGWKESLPTVYSPVPFEEMELLSRNETEMRSVLDAMQFKIMDGAHRITALQRLQKDRTIPEIQENFMIQVKVVSEDESMIQRTLDAAAENNSVGKVFAKKTFCDDLWTMLKIQCHVVERIVTFSTAIADHPPTTMVSDPDAAIRPSKKAATKKRVEFRALRNLPQETPAFVEAYGKHIDRRMKQPNALHLRRAFDPTTKDDFALILGPVVLALTTDSHIASSATPIAQNEGVRVKWRILLKLLPFHVQIQQPTGEDGLTTGGTGIVCARGRDTRLWDFMCLVNDSLTSKSVDTLSYHRIYRTSFALNAYEHVLCGVLMMMVGLEVPATQGPTVSASESVGRPAPEPTLARKHETTCCIFMQYDAAASLLKYYDGVEDLLSPHIILDRNTLRFAVVGEKDEWTCRAESFSFGPEALTTKIHPILGRPYDQLEISEKTHNEECRALASSFLSDIERIRTLSTEQCAEYWGSLSAGRTVTERLEVSQITSYVRSKFQVLRVAGFAELLESYSREDNAPDSSDDNVDEGPPSQRLRLTQPDADIHEAKNAAVECLLSVDKAHMFAASFEEFTLLPEARSLVGKVSLVLTDPPYNTRREAGASNSEYDKMSSSAIKQTADFIEQILTPHGHAFIFCSYQQSAEWREALEGAGGGSCLKVPKMPEVIIRDPSVINSSGNFVYHRVNAAEYAWHVFKDNAAGSSDTYRSTVGFGNANLGLVSGTSMPPFCNVIDRYVPPKGPELIRSDGKIVRPEQKSVKLMRDLIRLFAPNASDIVVDLFAGTMSTVVAAIHEGRPVYACEKDKHCFEIGKTRVHNFQYRRAAAGLLRPLSNAQVALLRTSIPPRSDAPDTVAHEPETYDTEEVLRDT